TVSPAVVRFLLKPRTVTGGCAVPEDGVGVDVFVDGQDGVQEAFHGFSPVLFFPGADAAGGDRHAFHHVPVGEGKIGVVFEKVAVGRNVGDDQLVLKQGVGLQQKGVTGIGVDHQLVDFAQAEVVI